MNRRTFLSGLLATSAGVLVPQVVLAEPERRVWALDRSMIRTPWFDSTMGRTRFITAEDEGNGVLSSWSGREIDMMSETVMAQIHRDYWDGDTWTDFPVVGTLQVVDPKGEKVFLGDAAWDGTWHVRHNWNASAILVYDDATGEVISHHQWGLSL